MHESSLVRWLRRLIYGTTLIPLVIFAQFLSPFHFGKVILFRSIVEVMVVLYGLLIWHDRRYRPQKHPITWAFLGLALAFTVTTITSVAPMQSWWGTLERMGGLFTFWHYFAFYLITIAILRTRADWQKLIDFMVGVGLVSAIYGFFQRFNIDFIIGSGGRERIFGTIGNPALFAGYELLVALLALTIVMARKKFPAQWPLVGSVDRGIKYIGSGVGLAILIGLLSSPLAWLQGLWVVPLGIAAYGAYLFVAEAISPDWWYQGVTAILLLAVAMTVVRGSLLALVVAAVLYGILWSALFHSRVARRALLGTVAAVCFFVFLAMLLRNTGLVQNSPYLKRITDFSPSTTTVQTRFWAWSAGLKGWSENAKTMFLGWGPENFNVPFAKYFNPKFYTGPGAETFFDRAHNMFVEVLVTMGILGELAYLSLFATLFATLVRFMKKDGALKVVGIGLTVLTVAYIIHNSFIFDTSANFITFFMILAWVVNLDQRGLDPEPIKETVKARPVLTGLQQTMGVVAAVAVLILIYQVNVIPAEAIFTTTRGIVFGWNGDFVNAVKKFEEAIAYDTQGSYDVRMRFAQYLLDTSINSDTSKIPGFDQVMLAAIDDVKLNVRENPSDYLPLLYLSRLYITLGKSNPASPYNATALEYSTKALALSPTFVRTYYEIAQAYLNVGEYQKSFEWFKKASDLNPDVGITYWYMGVVKYQLKDYPSAMLYFRTALEKGYSMSENDTLKLISLYVDAGDIKGVVPLYEQLVQQHPDNLQYLTSLAVAYARVGRISDAVAAVRKAMAMNPTDAAFQQQAHAFLHQLGAE